MSMFRTLLPDSIAVAEIDPATVDERDIAPEERSEVAGAVAQRRRHFAAGRLLARRLLGEGAGPLLRGPDGAPRWPPGVRGCVTHCDRLAAVAIADARTYAGIGIDVEIDVPLPDGVEALVITPHERGWLDALHHEDRAAACAIVFSAKESIYKAQHARSGTFLEFSDVDLRLDLAHGTWEGTLRVDVPGYPVGTVFGGRHRRGDGLILTAVVIEAPTRTPG